jgi:hypothetical protein
MSIIIDDSHEISDYIRNMPREERKKKIAEYEKEQIKEREIRLKAKPQNA